MSIRDVLDTVTRDGRGERESNGKMRKGRTAMTAASGAFLINRAMRSYHRRRRKRAVAQLLVGLASFGFAAVSLRRRFRSDVDQSDVVATAPDFGAAVSGGDDNEREEEGPDASAGDVDATDVVAPETDLEDVASDESGAEGPDTGAEEVDETDVVAPETDLEDVSDGLDEDERERPDDGPTASDVDETDTIDVDGETSYGGSDSTRGEGTESNAEETEGSGDEETEGSGDEEASDETQENPYSPEDFVDENEDEDAR